MDESSRNVLQIIQTLVVNVSSASSAAQAQSAESLRMLTQMAIQEYSSNTMGNRVVSMLVDHLCRQETDDSHDRLLTAEERTFIALILKQVLRDVAHHYYPNGGSNSSVVVLVEDEQMHLLLSTCVGRGLGNGCSPSYTAFRKSICSVVIQTIKSQWGGISSIGRSVVSHWYSTIVFHAIKNAFLECSNSGSTQISVLASVVDNSVGVLTALFEDTDEILLACMSTALDSQLNRDSSSGDDISTQICTILHQLLAGILQLAASKETSDYYAVAKCAGNFIYCFSLVAGRGILPLESPLDVGSSCDIGVDCNNAVERLLVHTVKNVKVMQREIEGRLIPLVLLPYCQALLNEQGSSNYNPSDHQQLADLLNRIMDYVLTTHIEGRKENCVASESSSNTDVMNLMHPIMGLLLHYWQSVVQNTISSSGGYCFAARMEVDALLLQTFSFVIDSIKSEDFDSWLLHCSDGETLGRMMDSLMLFVMLPSNISALIQNNTNSGSGYNAFVSQGMLRGSKKSVSGDRVSVAPAESANSDGSGGVGEKEGEEDTSDDIVDCSLDDYLNDNGAVRNTAVLVLGSLFQFHINTIGSAGGRSIAGNSFALQMMKHVLSPLEGLVINFNSNSSSGDMECERKVEAILLIGGELLRHLSEELALGIISGGKSNAANVFLQELLALDNGGSLGSLVKKAFEVVLFLLYGMTTTPHFLMFRCFALVSAYCEGVLRIARALVKRDFSANNITASLFLKDFLLGPLHLHGSTFLSFLAQLVVWWRNYSEDGASSINERIAFVAGLTVRDIVSSLFMLDEGKHSCKVVDCSSDDSSEEIISDDDGDNSNNSKDVFFILGALGCADGTSMWECVLSPLITLLRESRNCNTRILSSNILSRCVPLMANVQPHCMAANNSGVQTPVMISEEQLVSILEILAGNFTSVSASLNAASGSNSSVKDSAFMELAYIMDAFSAVWVQLERRSRDGGGSGASLLSSSQWVCDVCRQALLFFVNTTMNGTDGGSSFSDVFVSTCLGLLSRLCDALLDKNAVCLYRTVAASSSEDSRPSSALVEKFGVLQQLLLKKEGTDSDSIISLTLDTLVSAFSMGESGKYHLGDIKQDCFGLLCDFSFIFLYGSNSEDINRFGCQVTGLGLKELLVSGNDADTPNGECFFTFLNAAKHHGQVVVGPCTNNCLYLVTNVLYSSVCNANSGDNSLALLLFQSHGAQLIELLEYLSINVVPGSNSSNNVVASFNRLDGILKLNVLSALFSLLSFFSVPLCEGGGEAFSSAFSIQQIPPDLLSQLFCLVLGKRQLKEYVSVLYGDSTNEQDDDDSEDFFELSVLLYNVGYSLLSLIRYNFSNNSSFIPAFFYSGGKETEWRKSLQYCANVLVRYIRFLKARGINMRDCDNTNAVLHVWGKLFTLFANANTSANHNNNSGSLFLSINADCLKFLSELN